MLCSPLIIRWCCVRRRVHDPESLLGSLVGGRAVQVGERSDPGRHVEAAVVQAADHARRVRKLLHVEVELSVRRRVAVVDLQLTIQRACQKPANRLQLECGQMPNVMVALPNTGDARCSTPQTLADAHYWSAVQ